MLHTKSTVRIGFISLVSLLLAVYSPALALANATETEQQNSDQSAEQTPAEEPPQEPDSSPTTTTPEPTQEPASEPTPGPQEPNGADANKYTYNEETGLWENDFYTWDPVTKQTAPKAPTSYSYNPETGRWDTTEYVYNPTTGTYEPIVASVEQPPEGAKLAASGLGPDSTNKLTDESSLTGVFDLFYNASISNNIYSSAHSGDASVLYNTLGGSAKSGDAEAIANVLNLLQSSFNPYDDGGLSTFVANIDGDVVGDLVVDPYPGGPGSLTVIDEQQTTDLDVNVAFNGLIDNDIELEATSGDATVSNNTTGGDATTGNATAMANVINMINSAIISGQSFIGSININGSLDGDILLPPNLLDTLLASNGPNSNLEITQANEVNLDVDVDNNQNINNNVSATASSGDATVSKNTTGGSAATGDAMTNVTMLNMAGAQTVAENALIVFVNVLGEWYGVIMDAPVGSTAAALGGGVDSNTVINQSNELDVDIDVDNNSTINNDIVVVAATGDATVSNNTTGGDATTGDAAAGVNLLNVVDSNMAFSDWFGVLFINVFGEWYGSFGVDTLAGNPMIQSSSPGPQSNSGGQHQTFQFIPGGRQSASTQNTANNLSFTASSGGQSSPPAETANQTPSDLSEVVNNVADHPAAARLDSSRDWVFPIFGTITGLSLLGAERVVSRKRD